MAGHSKFKNIQFRKGAQDKKRSKLFSKLSRDITLAAKQGLPDPTANARLRLAMANARADFFRRINAQILHQFKDMERAEAAAAPLSEEETFLLRQTKFLRQRSLSVFRGRQPGNMGSEVR